MLEYSHLREHEEEIRVHAGLEGLGEFFSGVLCCFLELFGGRRCVVYYYSHNHL